MFLVGMSRGIIFFLLIGIGSPKPDPLVICQLLCQCRAIGGAFNSPLPLKGKENKVVIARLTFHV